ncbi:hypothetical protein K432DRAFT_447684 [Lepidopterella palustris CBS 459.81]|uniref:Apple domain-containing protein n=1 Tax=Lepidopterella palustris CBS 459.81 TaxID=1314670 RepID=A0A8E2J906_9PEZI|nr:hypothetical protein K432DRAFT_447684 [Lepidopterella palustris CBS 459.81]
MAPSFFLLFISLSSLAKVAFAALSCPDSAGQTFVDPNSQKSYVVECGVDRPGADLPGSPVWVTSLEACIAQCSTTANCVNVAYAPGSPGPCYLKKGLNPGAANTNIIAAHLPSTEGTRCPDNDNTCINPLPAKDGCYQVECNTSRSGSVLSQVIATSFDDCFDKCEAQFLNGCVYVSFQPGVGAISPGGTCTLQTSISSTETPVQGTWGGRRAASMCPDFNDNIYTSWTGRRFLIECGIDRPGGDMQAPVWVDGIFSCLQACAQTPGCIDSSWHFGFPSGPCYLKNQIMNSVSDTAVMNAKWVPDCTSGIATSTITKYTTTVTSTTSIWTSSLYTPLYLYNLQRLPYSPTATPLTYGATPSAIPVPGGAQCFGWVGPGCVTKRGALPALAVPEADSSGVALDARALEARDSYTPFCTQSSTTTSTFSTATTATVTFPSTTCTRRSPGQSTTVPAYCEPTFSFNLPSVPPELAAIPENNIYTAPSITTENKLACCDACTNIFNCVWWKFDFGAIADVWKPGTCTFAYRTNTSRIDDGNTPAVCPNGVYEGPTWDNHASTLDGWPNNIQAWYNTGYNPGACGGGFNLFESNLDEGLAPDDYYRKCPDQN